MYEPNTNVCMGKSCLCQRSWLGVNLNLDKTFVNVRGIKFDFHRLNSYLRHLPAKNELFTKKEKKNGLNNIKFSNVTNVG